ncbi:MAG: hypothetical protein JRI82_16370 [Deltaproteobacteria bacterium]|nr:hypothetical protein [Deltaproteobacteria bacterium]
MAESILRRFSDTPWARQVYAKAEKTSDANTYMFELATSITNKLDDGKWATRLRNM